jgi:hypothetical protein
VPDATFNINIQKLKLAGDLQSAVSHIDELCQNDQQVPVTKFLRNLAGYERKRNILILQIH